MNSQVDWKILSNNLEGEAGLNLHNFINDTLKAFDDFKNKQKSVQRKVFWYVKVHIFWKLIQCAIHWDKVETLQKFP